MDVATQAAIDTAFWTAALFWATLFLGVATLALGWVAIWGDWAKARWFKPKLTVTLLSADGMDEVSVRCYRLLVTNRAHSRATNVEVFLLRVEQVVSGTRNILWASEMPLIWMNASTRDKAPTLSRDAPEVCDLLYVGEGHGLRLAPQADAHSLERIMKWHVGTPVHLILTVEARSDEARSSPVSIEVNWGGGWLPDAAEMAKALQVRVLN